VPFFVSPEGRKLQSPLGRFSIAQSRSRRPRGYRRHRWNNSVLHRRGVLGLGHYAPTPECAKGCGLNYQFESARPHPTPKTQDPRPKT
jgi:hypothetical protein